jgi:exodeoxyribonuclease VII large subunit
MVFGNATLEAICAATPKNAEELLEIKGMGEKKVKKYGAQILKLVNSEQAYSPQSRVTSHEPSEGPNVDFPASNSALTTSDSAHKQQVSVSEYLEYLNLVLQKTADVKIVGEVSASKIYPSGFYFTLKDTNDETALSCYLPAYTYKGLGVPLEDGMQISVEGVPRLVKRNGRFQFTVENVELVGEGSLKKAYELLKARFTEEGLFDRKRPLPNFARTIGVVTSRAGAVIHDFQNNIAKRGFKIYLKDVRVEGASSPAMVVSAIKYFNNLPAPPDVLVIMRGGGSFEDLQGFNSEEVVRAVFGSRVPTIVAIGHDKDVPLAQLAADVMVSTPTAAAHAVSATWDELFTQLPALESDLLNFFTGVLGAAKSEVVLSTESLHRWCASLGQSYQRLRLALLSSRERYGTWVTAVRTQLARSAVSIVQYQSKAYEGLAVAVRSAEQFLEQANPERQLALGYSIVKTERGTVVRSVRDVARGDRLHTQVGDGAIISSVE